MIFIVIRVNYSYVFSDLSKKHELMKVLSHESTSNAVDSIWKKSIYGKFMNLTLSPRFLFLSNLGSDLLFFLIFSFMLLTGMCVKAGFLLIYIHLYTYIYTVSLKIRNPKNPDFWVFDDMDLSKNSGLLSFVNLVYLLRWDIYFFNIDLEFEANKTFTFRLQS